MSDKERFENMSPIGFDLNGDVLLKSEDYHWLMEQAECVEELELEINDWRAEVQKWQKFYKESEESHSETKELLKSIVNQNKRYREALEEIARGRFSGASYKARKALEGEAK
jgi:hypothetical protein